MALATTWSLAIANLVTLTEGISAPNVTITPAIFPDSVGIYAGRLAHSSASVADSPMRTLTGAIVGKQQANLPVDSDGIRFSSSHAKAMNDQRYSVINFYPDYPGLFFSDGQMLDVETSDYFVIENLRIVNKVARKLRLILIAMIANRQINSTPISMAYTINKLMQPLRDMSKSAVLNGIPFPAELKPPVEGDIVLNWKSHTELEVFMTARPFESPKKLTANIVLDLSAPLTA
jgi:hypothetical protein